VQIVHQFGEFAALRIDRGNYRFEIAQVDQRLASEATASLRRPHCQIRRFNTVIVFSSPQSEHLALYLLPNVVSPIRFVCLTTIRLSTPDSSTMQSVQKGRPGNGANHSRTLSAPLIVFPCKAPGVSTTI
jgi:hypothetical protein